jgi:amino acid transporter
MFRLLVCIAIIVAFFSLLHLGIKAVEDANHSIAAVCIFVAIVVIVVLGLLASNIDLANLLD